MPVQSCQLDGKPGFRWGESGKCYTYETGDTASRRRARSRAQAQGAAIEANKGDITVEDVPVTGPEQGGGFRPKRRPLEDLSDRRRREMFRDVRTKSGESAAHGRGRIAKIDAYRQIVFAEVYVPDYPDSHGDYATADTIEKMAHGFLRDGRSKSIDVEHDNELVEAYLAESFIAREGDPDFIAGSWVAAVKIEDPGLWQKVLDGQINGFSFEGLARARPGEVEIEVRETVTVKSADAQGHRHDVVLRFDPETGDFLGGETTPGPDGHVHEVTKGTSTDRAGSPAHSHRFSYIEEVA